MLPYQRRSGVTSPRTGEVEAIRPSTRPVALPRSVRPPRPELAVRVDDEMTTMMPSRSAAHLPPPPDAYTARIPRQWSPVEQVVGTPSTMPSFVPPASMQPTPLSQIPGPPSSLQGLTVANSSSTINVDTARVRTGRSKLARPTLSWAAALVALGIFVGIGSAFVNRGEASAKTRTVAAGKVDKQDKSKGALTANKAAITAAKVAPPPPPSEVAPQQAVLSALPVLPTQPAVAAQPAVGLPPSAPAAAPASSAALAGVPGVPGVVAPMLPPGLAQAAAPTPPGTVAPPPLGFQVPAQVAQQPAFASAPRRMPSAQRAQTAASRPDRSQEPSAPEPIAKASTAGKKVSAKEVADLATEQLGLSL